MVEASNTTASAELPRSVRGRLTPLHLIGGLALVFLLLQIATGVLLLAYYRPTPEEAHFSIALINDEVRFGWLVRGLHYWGGDLLLACAFLHLIRAYFAHAYETPRQLTWVSGILLVVILIGFGLTGTLLPWDRYAYGAVDAARVSIQGIPYVGGFLLALLWGGWEIGREVLLRFYVLHTGILPWVAAALLCAHLALVWRLGVKGEDAGARPPSTPVAEVLLGLFITALFAIGVAMSLAVLRPPLLLETADPVASLAEVAPRWYLRPARTLLRGLSPGVAAATVFALFLLATLLPFLDGRPIRSTWRRVVRWALGALVLAALLWLALQVDGG